jgi:hypothetical protein
MAVPILVGEFASNSSDANEKVAVRDAIIAYNVANDPDLPQLLGAGTDPSLINGWTTFVAKTATVLPYYNGGDDQTFGWAAPGTYSNYYVMTKFGQGQANFDHALHLLSAGDTLVYNPGGSGAPNGLAHLAIWAVGPANNSVPDACASFSLLGVALLGLAVLRRRL